jgi:hypothetical protein
METVQMVTKKHLSVPAMAVGISVLFVALTAGCVPDDDQGIEINNEADREQLHLTLESEGIRHRFDENGVIWYDPENEEAVTNAIAQLSTSQTSSGILTGWADDYANDCFMKLLSEHGIEHRTDHSAGNSKVYWTPASPHQEKEITEAVLRYSALREEGGTLESACFLANEGSD